MSEVKTRLAAAGWSDRTRGGKLIIFAASDDDGIHLSGVIKVDRGVFAVNWDSSGKAYSRDNDLVPLPANVDAVKDEKPDAERISESDLSRLLQVYEEDTDVYYAASELIAARQRIAELEAEVSGLVEGLAAAEFSRDTSIDIARGLKKERDELRERRQCPPVQKLATSGPSITRPVPAVDAWMTYDEHECHNRYRVDAIETINGETRIISGSLSIYAKHKLTGPSDRGPWRPIGEVK